MPTLRTNPTPSRRLARPDERAPSARRARRGRRGASSAPAAAAAAATPVAPASPSGERAPAGAATDADDGAMGDAITGAAPAKRGTRVQHYTDAELLTMLELREEWALQGKQPDDFLGQAIALAEKLPHRPENTIRLRLIRLAKQARAGGKRSRGVKLGSSRRKPRGISARDSQVLVSGMENVAREYKRIEEDMLRENVRAAPSATPPSLSTHTPT